jgi:hypothetical protein
MAEGTKSRRIAGIDSIAIAWVMPLLLFFIIADLALLAESRAIRETRAIISSNDQRNALSPSAFADLREDVAFRPLSANLLNRVLVSWPADETRANAGWILLDSLGLRAQDARYNLLLRAAEQGDGEAVMRHIDVLLRRGKGRDELYGILSAFERQQDTRALLAGTLRSSPPWAADYVSNVKSVVSRSDLENRLDLLRSVEGVVRIPAADLSGMMAKAIEYQDDESLSYLDRIARLGDLRFAPAEANAALPTQWIFPQSDAIQSFAIDDADATVRVEFSGSRSQTVVSRHLVLTGDASRTRGFTMMARSEDGGELPQLILRIVCPQGTRVMGVVTSQRQNFRIPSPLPCAIPRLELVAISAAMARPSTFDLAYGARGLPQ